MDACAKIRSGRLWALGLLLAILSSGPAMAQLGSAQQGSPPVSPDPAWQALESEFMAAWQAHQVALQKAQAEGLPPNRMPKSPTKDYWERCKTFADRGEVAAIRWCITYSQDPELPAQERGRRRLELYQGWAKNLPEGPGLKEVVKNLSSEAQPSRLGLASATAVCAQIAERVQDRSLRGAARLAQGLMLLAAKDSASTARARELIELGIEDDPQGEAVVRARGKLFQLDHLQIGKPCPDFTAKDVDGVEIKLSDSLGKVVVLDFWGFWCPPCRAMIPHNKALVKRLESEPFALIGISTDQDKAEHKKLIASNGITWRNAFDGSSRGPLCTAWGVSSFPTIYVLDAKGTIRHIGLRGEDLEHAVDALIREAKEGGQDPRSKDAKPPSKGSQEGTKEKAKEKAKEEGEKLDPEAPGAPELPESDPRTTKSSNRAISIS